jgi:hypothetical protein
MMIAETDCGRLSGRAPGVMAAGQNGAKQNAC